MKKIILLSFLLFPTAQLISMHARAAIFIRSPALSNAPKNFLRITKDFRNYGCTSEPNPTKMLLTHAKNGRAGYALYCLEKAVQTGTSKEEIRKIIEQRKEPLLKELETLNLVLSTLSRLEASSEEIQKDLNCKTNSKTNKKAITDEDDDLLMPFITIVNLVGDK